MTKSQPITMFTIRFAEPAPSAYAANHADGRRLLGPVPVFARRHAH
jgi:hypothetical protein